MTAAEHTRYYHEHGGLHHALAAVYIDRRERGESRTHGVLAAVKLCCVLFLDWLMPWRLPF